MQADSLLSEPLEKIKNTRVGSLSPSPADLPEPRNLTGTSCIAGEFFTS